LCRDNEVKMPLPGVEERSKIGDKTSPFPSADIVGIVEYSRWRVKEFGKSKGGGYKKGE
jgi:hypothetical protein